MSLANGNEEKIVDYGEAQRWDVFERGICYVAVTPEGGASIECRDVTSRSVKQVAMLEKEPLPVGFSVSPDGESILFIRVDKNESDLMTFWTRAATPRDVLRTVPNAIGATTHASDEPQFQSFPSVRVGIPAQRRSRWSVIPLPRLPRHLERPVPEKWVSIS